MAKKTVLILGGYGNTGRLIARYLLEQSDTNVILAGRNKNNADTLANEFNLLYEGDRVKSIELDASHLPALFKALQNISLLLVASSTAEFAGTIAQACLSARVDYFDVQYSTKKVRALRALSNEIRNSGCCFITEGGFHPGLPAALIRYGASKFDKIHKANVASVIKMDWSSLQFSDATIIEMAGEFSEFSTEFFQHGRWKKGRMDIVMDTIKMDFGPPFGHQVSIPMFLEELRNIPAMFPTLTDFGFFVGGFNFITDYILMPMMMAMIKIAPRKGLESGGRLLLWGLRNFSRPPFGIRLKLEAEGLMKGAPKQLEIILSHEDGYFFTAIPAVAAVLQLLDGSIRKPGLYTQGEIVEPDRLFANMRTMGIGIQTRVIE
jgi:saccharopine dehydrogenase (NAD+, L-lysine-forming)